MERRREPRQRVNLNCTVTPGKAWLSHVEIAGQIKDISRGGVLVEFAGVPCPEELRVIGNPVKILVELPPYSDSSPRYLQLLSRVVRVVDRNPACPAVAFEVYRVEIRSRIPAKPEFADCGEDARPSASLQ